MLFRSAVPALNHNWPYDCFYNHRDCTEGKKEIVLSELAYAITLFAQVNCSYKSGMRLIICHSNVIRALEGILKLL